jgi:23S rRNA (uracil1939-C5)-methyltransferase
MTQIPEVLAERPITYHTVTLGPLIRTGEAQAEITETDEAGEQRVLTLPVPAGLPGERVTIAVEAPLTPRPGKRRRRWKPRPPRVWITEIHEPSALRVTAPCPVFGICGGCQLQHLDYAAQLAWKREVVGQLLREIGHFSEPPLLPTVSCDEPWQYRNHMRFSVNREGQPGLTARGSRRVLPLDHCPIAHRQINRVLKVLSQHPNPRPQALVRCSTASDQVMLQPAPGMEISEQLTVSGLEVRTETMDEVLGGETFRIRPSSFFQTNSAQAEKMVRMVLDGLFASHEQDGRIYANDPQKLTIVDAYCGVGTFALLIARQVGRVIAIEESPSAIKDAQWNARETANIEILKGKVEDILPQISEQIDGFVIDPPRAGCQRVVLDTLINHPVARIVYVSCDPSTLARDLNILCHEQSIYRLRSVQPLDMFPQTAHIECVAVLERINA